MTMEPERNLTSKEREYRTKKETYRYS